MMKADSFIGCLCAGPRAPSRKCSSIHQPMPEEELSKLATHADSLLL
jgi:hypothetical protein